MSPALRSYADAVRYLDSFISFEKTPPPKYSGDHYELQRFHRLLAAVGHPERHLRCIHIAGTDGKGSTATYVAALLQAHGHRVGLYTSPHLFHYTERIQINRRPIPRQRFTQLLDTLSTALGQVSCRPPGEPHVFATVFELLTAAAFLYFHQERVDYAVIEVGLGGRLDATNVIRPLVSVITPIDRDHTDLLGKTLRKIATEKAGIIKAGRPTFTSRQKRAVMAVLKETSERVGSPLFLLQHHAAAWRIQPSQQGYRFSLRCSDGRVLRLLCPLLGSHQVHNFTLALLVAQYILEGLPSRPSPPNPEFLATAASAVRQLRWPGRSELCQRHGASWVLDGAHTPQGARALRAMLDDLFPEESVCHLLAFSRDKDVAAYVHQLIRPQDTILCCQSSHPRAMRAQTLLERIPGPYATLATLGGRPNSMVNRKPQSQRVVCVSGSLFWVADVRRAIAGK